MQIVESQKIDIAKLQERLKSANSDKEEAYEQIRLLKEEDNLQREHFKQQEQHKDFYFKELSEKAQAD